MDPFYTPELKAAYFAHWLELESLGPLDPRHSELRIRFFHDVWKDRDKTTPREWVEELQALLAARAESTGGSPQ
jgi:hypothetical protein